MSIFLITVEKPVKHTESKNRLLKVVTKEKNPTMFNNYRMVIAFSYIFYAAVQISWNLLMLALSI